MRTFFGNIRVITNGGHFHSLHTFGNAAADAANADAISTAKSLLESKGASYQNIYFPSDSAAGDFAGDIMAFPTTYVIDRSGAIVGEAMLGGIDNEDNMAALQKLIDQALANDSAK